MQLQASAPRGRLAEESSRPVRKRGRIVPLLSGFFTNLPQPFGLDTAARFGDDYRIYGICDYVRFRRAASANSSSASAD